MQTRDLSTGKGRKFAINDTWSQNSLSNHGSSLKFDERTVFNNLIHAEKDKYRSLAMQRYQRREDQDSPLMKRSSLDIRDKVMQR
jgi:hypothetical protein